MAATRYPQFCALARAAEVLGERWTLLIVRELLLGPKRFSDLRERLDGISPSVLTERLGRVEALGLVRRSLMPPPAASTVYDLTEHGEALRPAVHELIRWGGRLLHPRRKRERAEPDWMRLALAAIARRRPSPARRFLLRVREGRKEAVLHVAGGRKGTTVSAGAAPADATLVLDVPTLLALASGRLPLARAVESGAAEASGDPAALADFALLFESARPAGSVSDQPPFERGLRPRNRRSVGGSEGAVEERQSVAAVRAAALPPHPPGRRHRKGGKAPLRGL